VTNTYCVVFLFCFSSSCVPYVASFSGLIVHFLLPLQCSLTFIYNLEHKARYLHFLTSGQIFYNSSHQDRYFIILHIRTDIYISLHLCHQDRYFTILHIWSSINHWFVMFYLTANIDHVITLITIVGFFYSYFIEFL